MASLVGGIEDLVVENREVESEAEADWMGGSQVGLSDLGGSLVRLEGLVGRSLALVAHGELGEITVVVTLPEICISTCLGPVVCMYVYLTSCGRRPWTRRSGQKE